MSVTAGRPVSPDRRRFDPEHEGNNRLTEPIIMNIPFVELLEKTPANQHKVMENSVHQCANTVRSFSVIDGSIIAERVLPVDDVVDSGWVLTVCGFRLMEKGCKELSLFGDTE